MVANFEKQFDNFFKLQIEPLIKKYSSKNLRKLIPPATKEDWNSYAEDFPHYSSGRYFCSFEQPWILLLFPIRLLYDLSKGVKEQLYGEKHETSNNVLYDNLRYYENNVLFKKLLNRIYPDNKLEQVSVEELLCDIFEDFTRASVLKMCVKYKSMDTNIYQVFVRNNIRTVFDGVLIKYPLPEFMDKNFLSFKLRRNSIMKEIERIEDDTYREVKLYQENKKVITTKVNMYVEKSYDEAFQAEILDKRLLKQYEFRAKSPKNALKLLSALNNLIINNPKKIIFRLDICFFKTKYKKDLKLLMDVMEVLEKINRGVV